MCLRLEQSCKSPTVAVLYLFELLLVYISLELLRYQIEYTVYPAAHLRIAAIGLRWRQKWQKIPRFQIKRVIFWCNAGKSTSIPPLSPCWGRKACCKWKNLLLKPGTEPSTMSVGSASPKDSSYLFFFFLCLAHRRQRKDSFKNRQRRSTFQTWQLTCGKRFLVRILDLSKKEELNSFSCWLLRFDGRGGKKAENLIIEQMQMALTTGRT